MQQTQLAKLYQPSLPGLEEYAVPFIPCEKKNTFPRDLYNLRLLDGLSSSNHYGLPKLKGYIPSVISKPLAFHEARGIWKKGMSLKGWFIHFYIDDAKFDCIRKSPEKYLAMFKAADFIVAPDFSTYSNYPLPVMLKNAYDNLLLAAYYERMGVKVVANAIWSRPIFYDLTYSGQPINRAIFVNSKSLRLNDKKGVKCWLHGYNETIIRLKPQMVVRFGKIVIGEEAIYRNPIRVEVENPYVKAMRYGR